MKKIFLSLLFVGALTASTQAQKSEVTEAKRLWTIFQISAQQGASPAAPGSPASKLSPADRQIASIKEGILHTEKAIAHDKTKENPEAWAYHSLFTSSFAFIDSLNQENSLKYQKIAENAISKTESLDKEGTFKDEIENSKLNIRNAIVLRALKAYNAEDFEKAYNHFSDVLRFTPNDTTMYMNLGLIAKMGKKYPQAIENYKKYVSFGPADASDYYVEMINISTELMKDTAQALNIVKEGLAKYPEDPGIISAETDIYIASGDIEKSQTSLSKLIAKDGNKALYHFLMGETYYKQALNMQAERNKIDSKKVKEYEAVTAKMAQLIDKALPFYKRALELDPKFEPTLEMLKQIYGFKNDVDNFNDIKKKIDTLIAEKEQQKQ